MSEAPQIRPETAVTDSEAVEWLNDHLGGRTEADSRICHLIADRESRRERIEWLEHTVRDLLAALDGMMDAYRRTLGSDPLRPEVNRAWEAIASATGHTA